MSVVSVGAEADLGGFAAEEVGACLASLGYGRVGLAACGEVAVAVGVVVREIPSHGVENAPWCLRASGPVEVDRRVPVDHPCERRELVAHVGDVVVAHELPLSEA